MCVIWGTRGKDENGLRWVSERQPLMSKAKHPHAWSLTGAARAAREARIASAKFLVTPAMKDWHESGLMQALGFFGASNGGDPRPGFVRMLANLGYAPPYPDRGKPSDVLLQDEARYLHSADLFVLSPEMTDVVTTAALTLTLEDLLLMRAEDMPTPTGLVVLPHPLPVRTMKGELTDPRGFLWWSPARIVKGITGSRLKTVPAVHMSIYNDGRGPVQPRWWREFSAKAAAAGTPIPPLFLDGQRCFPLGQDFTAGMADHLSRFSRMTRQLGTMSHTRLAELGLDEDLVAGEYTPGQEIDDEEDLIGVKFLFAFWRLAEQRIAVMEQAPVRHAAQVTAERAGVPADVRVILLRRADEHHDSGQSTGTVNWQHRWPVRMHKVRQWYPSRGVHDILWRGPYVKGPADKPLIGGETAWGLVR